jgi:DNA polymerase
MNSQTLETVRSYLRQQLELGMPDFILAHKPAPVQPCIASVPPESSATTAAAPARPAGGELSFEEKRKALHELYHSVKSCANCTLANLRKNFVFGAGNASGPVMIIGEAPGEEEDLQGLPFVGAAGQLLTKMLEAINLDRKKDVFITNVLKCRPPGNRDPETVEAQGCRAILIRQIEIIAPKAILLLGRIAAHQLLQTTESLGTMRTAAHAYNGIPVIVTYHPAALLRYKQYKPAAWEDLQKLQTLLKQLGTYATA